MSADMLLVLLVNAASPGNRNSSHPVLLPLGCAPIVTRADTLRDWSLHEDIRDYIKINPTDNGWHVQFSRVDTLGIQTVRSDSLCDRAFAVIRGFLVDSAFWPTRLELARAGRYFIARNVVSSNRGNEFAQYFYVLEETLTHVLFPCSSGYADCH